MIALDYDKTYTADTELWDMFIESAAKKGHTVICITMRRPSEPITMQIPIYYTSRLAKKKFADQNGIAVDIWIDDKPAWLFEDAIW